MQEVHIRSSLDISMRRCLCLECRLSLVFFSVLSRYEVQYRFLLFIFQDWRLGSFSLSKGIRELFFFGDGELH
jgi:hypothetical protein